YFDRAFDEMTDKELETPLANSGLGVKAKLAPNSGTFVQFRKLKLSGLRRGGFPDTPDPGPGVQVPGHHDHRHAVDLRGAHGLPGDGGRAQLRPQSG
ncbi:MAG: hypothetical protein WCK89_04095, partial [bacterium]